MDIKTKCNIGDTLYFLKNNAVAVRDIKEISIAITKDEIKIFYCYNTYPDTIMGTNPPIIVNEKDCFYTKQDLLNSL